jgi:ATP phosphoribosyltransferase
MSKLKDKNLKLAIQKDGRLTEETMKILDSAGFEFESYHRKLFATCRNFPMEILFVRDDDIPDYVQTGVADLGIVGQNLIEEESATVTEILKLGFGFCHLTLAVPKESSYMELKDLDKKRVATSYPNTTKNYFKKNGFEVDVIKISGAVELTPSLGVADAIVDITATGSTMVLNDLRPVADVLDSEAVLVANPNVLNNGKRVLIDQLVTRFRGVIAAKHFKYIMMNAPQSSLEQIKEIASGLNSPTVMPLAKDGWIAIHAVVEENQFWDIAEKLKKLGAEGILVTPIEKLIL